MRLRPLFFLGLAGVCLLAAGCHSGGSCCRDTCRRPAVVNSVPIAAPVTAAPCPTCGPTAAPVPVIQGGTSVPPPPVPVAPVGRSAVMVNRL